MITLPRPEERISLNSQSFAERWRAFFREVHEALTGQRPIVLPTYYVTPATGQKGLPSASPAGQPAFIPDESGGAVLAFADGTNWRRVTDRAVVS